MQLLLLTLAALAARITATAAWEEGRALFVAVMDARAFGSRGEVVVWPELRVLEDGRPGRPVEVGGFVLALVGPVPVAEAFLALLHAALGELLGFSLHFINYNNNIEFDNNY
jgi:hypothetical protein